MDAKDILAVEFLEGMKSMTARADLWGAGVHVVVGKFSLQFAIASAT